MAARPGFLRHEGGKLDIEARIEVRTLQDTRDIYTPGVARVPQAIADDPAQLARYTMVAARWALEEARSLSAAPTGAGRARISARLSADCARIGGFGWARPPALWRLVLQSGGKWATVALPCGPG